MVWMANCNALFCSTFMKRNRKIYSLFQLASAVFMIVALVWLTISAPFVFTCQQEQSKMAKAQTPPDNNEEETANPFGNSTEEKAPTTNSNSFSEEYLHDHHVTDHFFSVTRQYHILQNAGTYIAFHGELLVPPPNAA